MAVVGAAGMTATSPANSRAPRYVVPAGDTLSSIAARLGTMPDADDNIRMSARFLRYLLRATGGSVTNTLAAYYQGLRGIRSGPIRPEAIIYVATVLAVRPSFR